jgi:hypothetical protein
VPTAEDGKTGVAEYCRNPRHDETNCGYSGSQKLTTVHPSFRALRAANLELLAVRRLLFCPAYNPVSKSGDGFVVIAKHAGRRNGTSV